MRLRGQATYCVFGGVMGFLGDRPALEREADAVRAYREQYGARRNG